MAKRTSCWKFWWLDNSRSQGPKRQLKISKQSSICSRGAGSSHSMDPGVSVQKQLHKKPREACKSSWNPRGILKVIYTDNSLEFGKACEDLSWNHCTPTPHRSETNGIVERAVRRVKEGTSAVLLQSGLNESWWADSMECYTYLRNVTDLLSDGKTPYERRFGQPFKGPIFPFGSLVEYHPMTAKDQSRIHQFGKKVLPGLFLGYALYAGEFGRVTYWLQTLRSWTRWAHPKSAQKDSMRKRWYLSNKENLFSNRRWTNQNPWRRGPGDGVSKACAEQAAVDSQGSRTCVCKHLRPRGGTCRGGRMNKRPAVVPSSRRGKNLQWDAKEEEPCCPPKKRVSGRHVVRGTDSPHLSWKCAQVTGKAGENGQYSGEVGGSLPWTRPSAPGCGDAVKALAGDQRLIQGGDRPRRRLWDRYRFGHGPAVLFRTETSQCTVRPT